MAKDKDRGIAYVWYVQQNKTAKEIAQKLKLTETTVGNWVKKYGWKEERNARENQVDKRIDNIKSVIDDITDDRSSARIRLKELKAEQKIALANKDDDEIQLNKDMISEIKREIIGYDDAISKWNKTLENFDKENRVSLSSYLYVMEEIFKDLQTQDPKLYLQTIDFQEQHINNVSVKIG
ncbi:terminase gpP N-terminus-related DNA-binding protein [Formosa sp. A9]|uniref:terminase gpP N-terminus-related DNA-binding protein n=1 Tax=Formosa sp. A9 TaxID=3442641 RepID=UPI003EC04983